MPSLTHSVGLQLHSQILSDHHADYGKLDDVAQKLELKTDVEVLSAVEVLSSKVELERVRGLLI